MSDAPVLTDADRALLAEAQRVAQAAAAPGTDESARLRRYLSLERALGRRGETLAARSADGDFVQRVMGALPEEPPRRSPAWLGVGDAAMRLLALPAVLVIVSSFHQTFDVGHWIAAAVLAVAPASLVLHGLRRPAVRVRDLVYAGALIACLCLTILALAQAIDSRLAREAGWCCFVLGAAVLGTTWAARLLRPDVVRRWSPIELFVCHHLAVVAFLGGSCLVLHF